MTRLTWIAPSLLLALVCGVAAAQEKEKKQEKQEPRQASGADRMASMREMMMRDDGAPKVGQEAPTFKLKSQDGKQTFDLSDFKGKKPVILLFGSYT